ncbi:DUF3347 domain-containing protein [Runella zeae]|uniref:DUF3347 domain-containing protein n=1 Tax=Runella zeae TaxID=94255 RepID=UPI00235207C3|nr:DUF3347 domain-containing protein [Runella zeae]
MNSISRILMVISVLLSTANSFAQIKNLTTETIKIFGNCETCKNAIEQAGNVKKIAKVDWNKDTQMAAIMYDSKKTNLNDILKRIALAGYDNEKFLAPDDVYAKLSECCRYERTLKPTDKNNGSGMSMKDEHHNHSNIAPSVNESTQNVSQLKVIFEYYFSLKDALVKTDADMAAAKASDLSNALKAVEMGKLSTEEHTVWMKIMKELTANAEGISKSKNISKQRETFALLSTGIYELGKVSKQETRIYYQHCPMYNDGKGANWLSKENAIKNPYYGSQMLTCGNTVETLN